MNIRHRLVLPGIGARKNASLILLHVLEGFYAGRNEVPKLARPGIGAEEAS